MNEKEALTLIAASEKDIFEIPEGNPGAITAMLETMSRYIEVDEKAVFGPYHVIEFLKENNFKGSSVWFLYKDICEQVPHNVIALIRGKQLGLLDGSLIERIATQDHVSLDFEKLIKDIREKIPFNTLD